MLSQFNHSAMRRSLCVLLYAIVFVPATAQFQREYEHTTHIDERVVVPMNTDLVKPSIEIMINGSGPHRFLLDTGAPPGITINADLVDELELETRPGEPVGDPASPGHIETLEVSIDEIAIGKATYRNVEGISWDRASLYEGVEDAPRGIVGFGLFQDALLTLDYPNQQVEIEIGELPEPDGKRIVKIDSDRGIPVVPITIDGEVHHAHLDSGSMGALLLPTAFTASLPLDGEPMLIGRARSVSATFDIYEATLNGDVVFGNHTISQPQLLFNDRFDAINIGSAILARFKLTFDQRNSRMLIEPGKDVAESEPPRKRRTYGLMVNPRAKPMTILNLIKNGIASKSGLQPGDVIVTINGTPTSELGMGKLAQEFRKETLVLVIERDGAEREFTLTLEETEEAEDG